jgi:nitric oxide reductase subunit B
VATAYLAAGIFLAPIIAGHERPHQSWLANGLLGAQVIVVVGSLTGELVGIHGWRSDLWAWFGNQGCEYLDLGCFWQILLSLGPLPGWDPLPWSARAPSMTIRSCWPAIHNS